MQGTLTDHRAEKDRGLAVKQADPGRVESTRHGVALRQPGQYGLDRRRTEMRNDVVRQLGAICLEHRAHDADVRGLVHRRRIG